jgi:hypothetical protein
MIDHDKMTDADLAKMPATTSLVVSDSPSKKFASGSFPRLERAWFTGNTWSLLNNWEKMSSIRVLFESPVLQCLYFGDVEIPQINLRKTKIKHIDGDRVLVVQGFSRFICSIKCRSAVLTDIVDKDREVKSSPALRQLIVRRIEGPETLNFRKLPALEELGILESGLLFANFMSSQIRMLACNGEIIINGLPEHIQSVNCPLSTLLFNCDDLSEKQTCPTLRQLTIKDIDISTVNMPVHLNLRLNDTLCRLAAIKPTSPEAFVDVMPTVFEAGVDIIKKSYQIAEISTIASEFTTGELFSVTAKAAKKNLIKWIFSNVEQILSPSDQIDWNTRHKSLFYWLELPHCLRVEKFAFATLATLTNLCLPKCNTIGESACAACLNLKAVSLPGCQHTKSHAFGGCQKLQKIYLDECHRVGDEAFFNCVSLRTIKLPACKMLGKRVFFGCKNLTRLYLTVADQQIFVQPDSFDFFHTTLCTLFLGQNEFLAIETKKTTTWGGKQWKKIVQHV